MSTRGLVAFIIGVFAFAAAPGMRIGTSSDVRQVKPVSVEPSARNSHSQEPCTGDTTGYSDSTRSCFFSDSRFSRPLRGDAAVRFRRYKRALRDRWLALLSEESAAATLKRIRGAYTVFPKEPKKYLLQYLSSCVEMAVRIQEPDQQHDDRGPSSQRSAYVPPLLQMSAPAHDSQQQPRNGAGELLRHLMEFYAQTVEERDQTNGERVVLQDQTNELLEVICVLARGLEIVNKGMRWNTGVVVETERERESKLPPGQCSDEMKREDGTAASGAQSSGLMQDHTGVDGGKSGMMRQEQDHRVEVKSSYRKRQEANRSRGSGGAGVGPTTEGLSAGARKSWQGRRGAPIRATNGGNRGGRRKPKQNEHAVDEQPQQRTEETSFDRRCTSSKAPEQDCPSKAPAQRPKSEKKRTTNSSGASTPSTVVPPPPWPSSSIVPPGVCVWNPAPMTQQQQSGVFYSVGTTVMSQTTPCSAWPLFAFAPLVAPLPVLHEQAHRAGPGEQAHRAKHYFYRHAPPEEPLHRGGTEHRGPVLGSTPVQRHRHQSSPAFQHQTGQTGLVLERGRSTKPWTQHQQPRSALDASSQPQLSSIAARRMLLQKPAPSSPSPHQQLPSSQAGKGLVEELYQQLHRARALGWSNNTEAAGAAAAAALGSLSGCTTSSSSSTSESDDDGVDEDVRRKVKMLDMEMDHGERQEMEMDPETGDLDVAHEIDLAHDAAGGNENDSILPAGGRRAANTTAGKMKKKSVLAGGPYTTARELSGADEDEEPDEVFSDEYLQDPPRMKLKRQNTDPTPVRRRGDSFYTPLRCWGTPDDDENLPAAWSRLEGVEDPPQEPPDDSDSSSSSLSGDERVLDLLAPPLFYSRHGTRHRRDRSSPAHSWDRRSKNGDRRSVRYVLSELAKVYQAPRHVFRPGTKGHVGAVSPRGQVDEEVQLPPPEVAWKVALPSSIELGAPTSVFLVPLVPPTAAATSEAATATAPKMKSTVAAAAEGGPAAASSCSSSSESPSSPAQNRTPRFVRDFYQKNARYAVVWAAEVEDLPGASISSSSRGVGAPDDHGLGPAHRVSLLPHSEEARRLAAEGYVPKFVEASDYSVHFSDVCFPKFAAGQGLRRSDVGRVVRFLVQKSVEPAELARTLADLDLAGVTVTARETDSTRGPGTSQAQHDDDSHLAPAMGTFLKIRRMIEQENKRKAVAAGG